MIKTGLIGYGYSARTFHLPLIEASNSLELVGISSSQAEAVGMKYPSVPVFENAQDLLAGGKPELVVITAPNDVHYDLAKLCLENGVHAVVEKPMATTGAEARELVRIAGEKSLLLSVFHNRRWDGDFLTVKRLIENHQIGDIRFFESRFDRFRPTVRQRWREQPGPGAGIWFDLGPHLVDQAIQLFGLPRALTARCLPLRDGSETTDYFHVLLHYRNLEVVLHASSFSAAPNVRFRVEGTRGSFVKYGCDPQEAQLKNGMTPNAPLYGVETEEHHGCLYSESSRELVETEAGCYQRYYSGITAAILSGGPTPVNPEDAAAVIGILELAEQSSINGQSVSVRKTEN